MVFIFSSFVYPQTSIARRASDFQNQNVTKKDETKKMINNSANKKLQRKTVIKKNEEKKLKETASKFQLNPAEDRFEPQSYVGLSFFQKDNQISILNVYPNSVGETAGLRHKDIVKKIDNIPVITKEQVIELMSGVPGSPVLFEILRKNVTMKIVVHRGSDPPDDYRISWAGSVPIIKIQKLSEHIKNSFRNEIKQLVLDSRPKSIIIDLRDNEGGLLYSIEPIVSCFVRKGAPFSRIKWEDDSDLRSQYKYEISEHEPIFPVGTKIVVLINEHTAAGAEVVASALQESGIATLVGVKTAGYGKIEQVLLFTDGSTKRTVEGYFITPQEKPINKVGIYPDIPVAGGKLRDVQLEKGLQAVKALAPSDKASLKEANVSAMEPLVPQRLLEQPVPATDPPFSLESLSDSEEAVFKEEFLAQALSMIGMDITGTQTVASSDPSNELFFNSVLEESAFKALLKVRSLGDQH